LYSLGAALVFHEIFFPESSTAMALILAMGTYGAGYVARIVGAFIFGKMGDRIGRKKVLFITITMMGICTTLIGVLPTYAQIGVFAPILLVTLRIIQGLGAGAEISGAGTMLAEYAPKGKRGIISSFVAMGTNCGTLSATAIWAFMFFILSKEELLAWGWRIPFLASVVVMVFAIWLRMNLKESPVFEKVNDSNQPTAKPAPAGSIFQSKSFWLATGLRFGQAGNSGLIQTFLAGYLVGPILAGIFCTMTESWYPIAIMIMAYSVIGLISALKMPEVKDRDLSALEDAAEDQPRVVRAAQPSRSL
ncbi:MFS transporter, partial [Escherichia coli]|nr:MHS family MFS transporter [Escherichia coli]